MVGDVAAVLTDIAGPVDALTGEPRNDWDRFAGPTWGDRHRLRGVLAARPDLVAAWTIRPPLGVAVKNHG